MTQDHTILVHNGKVYQLDRDEIPKEVVGEIIRKLQQQLKLTSSPPPLEKVINLNDFEEIASKFLKPEVWAYYRTGSLDEITLRENISSFAKIFFKPRVLQDVRKVDTSTRLLGTSTSLPIYITAFANSEWGNPLAEKIYTRAAGETNLIYMIPTMSKYTLEEIKSEAHSDQTQWLQIYISSTGKEESFDKIKQAEQLGNISSIAFTIDTAQLGKRESEDRELGKGVRAQRMPHDPSFDWNTLLEYRNRTNLKIILKGIQTKEDALKAAELGIDAIIISNHGGRQLDSSRPTIQVLAEVVPYLKANGYYHKIEVLVDGGIRRGNDVVKALCLGANGVGLGRSFLYSGSIYGKDGVKKAIEILNDEIKLSLRLLGVNRLDQLNENYLDLTRLH